MKNMKQIVSVFMRVNFTIDLDAQVKGAYTGGVGLRELDICRS